ncbi:hypothetical protein [Planomonospora algeriensis]
MRIARKGIEPGTRPNRHRRVIERTIAWPFGHRRPSPRHERHSFTYLASLTLPLP